MSSVIAALSLQRKALEMTQAQLAERSGMNRMSVQKIESGETDPRLSSIMELARAMGLELLVVPSTLRPELDAFVRAGELVPDTLRLWQQAQGLELVNEGFVEVPVEDAASIPGVVTKFSAVNEGRRYIVKRDVSSRL